VRALISTLHRQRVRPLAASGTSAFTEGGQDLLPEAELMMEKINAVFEMIERGEFEDVRRQLRAREIPAERLDAIHRALQLYDPRPTPD
jgi:hypothetical protein